MEIDLIIEVLAKLHFTRTSLSGPGSSLRSNTLPRGYPLGKKKDRKGGILLVLCNCQKKHTKGAAYNEYYTTNFQNV